MGTLGRLGIRTPEFGMVLFFPVSGFRWSGWGARTGWAIQFLMELSWEVGVQRGDAISMNQGAKLASLSPPFSLQDAPGSEGVSGAAGHGE